MKVFLGGRKTNELLAISPLSGRYKNRLSELEEFVSEFGLIKARLGIEIKYFFALSKTKILKLSGKEKKRLLKLLKDFEIEDAIKIKKIEEQTRHDVKAVELFLRDFLSGENAEMLHFGLTSEDINNLSYRITLRSASENVIYPSLKELLAKLHELAKARKNIPMLARTHGQAAVPTTLGKEFAVFASRLSSEFRKLNKIQLTGKLNGAVGNYNALNFANPQIDWVKFSKKFVQSLGFEPNLVTTQINSSEDIIEYFQALQRINGIILDLNQDLWRYISDGWFVQKSERTQVGSSTMPQKINPIDFENSEGNLELANGLIEVLSRKLPVSRLQRDLSNSTIIRNLGAILGYSLLAYKGTLTGLLKINPNNERITKGLNEDWSILAEALQTILRVEGVKDSYSKVLEFTKGKHFGEKEWKEMVGNLEISKASREKLINLSPSTYIGLASKLATKK
jgi:adenylosuccinate lyase